MKKYNSYKPSGVDWLNQIPEHWNISRLKYLGVLYGGLTGKSGVDFNNDENPKNKPYIPYTNIFNNTYISKNHFHFVSIEDDEIQNRVKKYDIFFLMSSETFKDLGKSCILIDDVEELYLNSFCKGYRIKDKNIYPLFLNYQLLGHLHREMISYEGKGFTRINLRQEKLNDLFVFIPPLSEQLQIVKFLDEKTELIDKLISTKERKIDLLKQQRTSLINEVITKGLNPNVKMKNSGLEWIGVVPENWGVSKLGFYTTKIGSGSTPKGGSEIYEETGIPFIRSQNVHFSGLNLENISFINENIHKSMLGSKVVKGDVLLNITGGSIGRCCVVNEDMEMNVNQHVSIIRTKKKLLNYYLNYLLSSNVGQSQVDFNLTGGNREGLTIEGIRNFIVPLPNLHEQTEIVNYLDKKTNEIDYNISCEKKKIELLKGYRQSLISEVITGKIDVRTNLN